MAQMTYSKTGLALTEQFESCRLTAYQDVKGVWTIGWGHTGPDVIQGLICTQEQADDWLDSDMYWAQNVVNNSVKVPLTQNEFDALVDFVFNCGAAAFTHSTMLELLNEGDYKGAASQFDLWDHASGKVVAGLLRRREAETQLFQETT
jgi:lysozyme